MSTYFYKGWFPRCVFRSVSMINTVIRIWVYWKRGLIEIEIELYIGFIEIWRAWNRQLYLYVRVNSFTHLSTVITVIITIMEGVIRAWSSSRFHILLKLNLSILILVRCILHQLYLHNKCRWRGLYLVLILVTNVVSLVLLLGKNV